MKRTLRGTDLNVEVVEASRLTTDCWSTWSAIRQTDPKLANPHFCPEFAQAVAGVRSDLFVGIIRRGGKIAGFFPFHRSRFAIGCPVGDWLSQLNAVVMPPGLSLDARELVRSCGLRGWDFEYLPASLPQFKPYHRTRDVFSFMDLSRGYGAYAAERCRSGTQQIKSIVTLERKFERDVGPLKFEFHTREPRVLDALMDWRFDKYGSRGTSDVRRDPWAWTLVQRLHGLQSADFAGVLSVLSANGRPIAAHMGMRSRTVLQYWLPAYDPACARYSPGLILLLRMAQQAPAAGLRTIDLGGGQFPYKKRLMSGQYDVAGGSVGMPGLATAGSRLRRLAYEWVRKSKVLRPPAIAVAQGIDQLVRVFK